MRATRFDLRKLSGSVTVWVVAAVVIIVQPLLALIAALSYARIGVDATPATHPELAEPLPPVPFIGFDVLGFGEVAIVVLGAILGSCEFRSGDFRTTMLSIGSRPRVALSKFLAFSITAVLMSFVSIYATIATTQAGLGSQGINPLTLEKDTWDTIVLSLVHWLCIAVVCYCLAVVTRTWIVTVLLMVPQVVGLGDFLVSKTDAGHYLPVAAGRCLAETPDLPCTASASSVIVALMLWFVAALAGAWFVLVKRDVGK